MSFGVRCVRCKLWTDFPCRFAFLVNKYYKLGFAHSHTIAKDLLPKTLCYDVVMEKPETPVKKIVELEEHVARRLAKERNMAVAKFPLLFTLLTTFGIVATFYGFEHLIDQNVWLADNPLLLLAVGLGCLVLTGALYKKLG